jgi:transcriptional regulator with XRE-family HTH domain
MLPRKDKDNAPHPIDIYVGGRMRLRRIQLGLSQGALASKIGVSFQAVQKYESGDIRISASRLYDVAQVLQVSPAFFFEGYPDGLVAKNLAQEVAPEVNETFDRREIMSLIRGYYGIKDPQLQADILRLIAKLGNRELDQEQPSGRDRRRRSWRARAHRRRVPRKLERPGLHQAIALAAQDGDVAVEEVPDIEIVAIRTEGDAFGQAADVGL